LAASIRESLAVVVSAYAARPTEAGVTAVRSTPQQSTNRLL
jgi:hypothetical protein